MKWWGWLLCIGGAWAAVRIYVGYQLDQENEVSPILVSIAYLGKTPDNINFS